MLQHDSMLVLVLKNLSCGNMRRIERFLNDSEHTIQTLKNHYDNLKKTYNLPRSTVQLTSNYKTYKLNSPPVTVVFLQNLLNIGSKQKCTNQQNKS